MRLIVLPLTFSSFLHRDLAASLSLFPHLLYLAIFLSVLSRTLRWPAAFFLGIVYVVYCACAWSVHDQRQGTESFSFGRREVGAIEILRGRGSVALRVIHCSLDSSVDLRVNLRVNLRVKLRVNLCVNLRVNLRVKLREKKRCVNLRVRGSHGARRRRADG
jgi:hypothetical protein